MPSAESLQGLIKFIGRAEWKADFHEVMKEHVGPACSKLDIEERDINDIFGEVQGMTVWGCALEDFMARDLGSGRNVVDAYLKRRGYAESALNKRYMQALRHAVISLYEVSDIVPGSSFLARDLIRGGEPLRVTERTATQIMKPWDRISARVVRLGEQWHMSGGVLLFERKEADFMIETLRPAYAAAGDRPSRTTIVLGTAGATMHEPRLTAPPLELAGPLFTSIWLMANLDRVLNPRLPEMHNTDGDPIVMCTVTFPIQPGVEPARLCQALAKVDDLHQENATFFNWLSEAEPNPKREATKPTSGLVIASSHSNGAALLGSIEVDEDEVVFTCNSRERAERGQALVVAALGAHVGPPTLEAFTPAELLAPRDADKEMDDEDDRSPKSEPLFPSEQERAIIHAQLDNHYTRRLDQSLPVLGAMTPREAAKSAAGRQKLVDWLKDHENRSATSGADPLATYDLGCVWRELGVAELRV